MTDDRCNFAYWDDPELGDDMALIECPCCEGYGAHPTESYAVYERGCAFPHYDHDEVPCTFCLNGRVLAKAEPITLDDLLAQANEASST